MPPDQSTTGFRFKEGKLYIFQPHLVMLIHCWPKLEAVCKREKDASWKAFEPGFRLVAPYRPAKRKAVPSPQMELPLDPVPTLLSLSEKRKRSFDSFRFAMPREIAACLEPFQSLQWRLLLLFRAEPRAVEVCRSNPALVFCLANADKLGDSHPLALIEDAAREVLKKQRELMSVFGLPDTPAAVKATARILPEAVSCESMMQWRKLQADKDAARMLSHLRRINAGVIALLSDPLLRALITPALLNEVAQSPREKYRGLTAARLDDILLMQTALRGGEKPRKYADLGQVTAHHDELTRHFSKHRLLSAFKSRFPRPPLAGIDHIVPVRTPADLAVEGREQSNCVASYADKVFNGGCYIYRVLKPERATLSIVRGAGGDWEIDQLLLHHNREVSPATLTQVETWLDQFAISA